MYFQSSRTSTTLTCSHCTTLGKSLSHAIAICVGISIFLNWVVRGQTIEVGENWLPVLFCTMTHGRTPPKT